MNYFHFLAKNPVVTVFPATNLIVDGKKCIPGGRTFFFDLESYEGCGIQHYGEVYAGCDSVVGLSSIFGQSSLFEELLLQQKRIERYFKIFEGIGLQTIIYNTPAQKEILKYYKLFDEVLTKIFQRSQKPNYKFMRDSRFLVEKIAQNRLNIDKKQLKHGTSYPDRVLYNIYKSSTGRYITKNKSFPIHNLAKEKRDILRPNNKIFVQMDQVAADFRCFLYVFSGDRTLPSMVSDLYTEVEGDTREEKKKNVYKMIYSRDVSSEIIGDLNVVQKVYKMITKETADNLVLQSPVFKRELLIPKSSENIDHLMISHVMQSITSDITVDACLKIFDILKNTKSFIAFTIHDAIVLDMTIEDYHDYMKKIKSVIEDTPLGRYFWKVTVGNSFGSMYHEGDFDWNRSY